MQERNPSGSYVSVLSAMPSTFLFYVAWCPCLNCVRKSEVALCCGSMFAQQESGVLGCALLGLEMGFAFSHVGGW